MKKSTGRFSSPENLRRRLSQGGEKKGAQRGERAMNVENKIRADLFAMQDLAYREFHSKLIPTQDKDFFIGVRTPQLRAYAKKLWRNQTHAEAFMNLFPHKYYEEKLLHGFLIEQNKDFEETVRQTDLWLMCVDNWAICDMVSPKIFKRHTDALLSQIQRWMHSGEVYTVRFGINMLQKYFLSEESFSTDYLDWVVAVDTTEYYVNMMRAWFFATALTKQYEATVSYIEEKRLDAWTHNKAIQKAVESKQISNERKAYLKTRKVT